jgi:hypothetical protein
MFKLILFFCFLFLGCSSNKCLVENSDLHSRFVDIFKADKMLLAKASKEDIQPYKSEIRLKEKILSKICKYLNGTKKFLYLEEISPVNMSRVGLVYLYDKDESVYFIVDNDLDITVNTLYVGYDHLKRVIAIVKSDFNNEANRLKDYFQKISMSDVPSLQLVLIDLTKDKKLDSRISFIFSSSVLDDEGFNKEFPKS